MIGVWTSAYKVEPSALYSNVVFPIWMSFTAPCGLNRVQVPLSERWYQPL
jgi:hypothetical protein